MSKPHLSFHEMYDIRFREPLCQFQRTLSKLPQSHISTEHSPHLSEPASPRRLTMWMTSTKSLSGARSVVKNSSFTSSRGMNDMVLLDPKRLRLWGTSMVSCLSTLPPALHCRVRNIFTRQFQLSCRCWGCMCIDIAS